MRKYSTISNGDCLFAAFAMAWKRERLTPARQKKGAALLRRQVAQAILDGEYIVTVPLEAEDVSAFLENPAISRQNIKNASENHGNYQKWKRAYSRIIGTPQAWAGGIELSVLSDLYDVKIIVLSDESYIEVGHSSTPGEDGIVYLFREGTLEDRTAHYSGMF